MEKMPKKLRRKSKKNIRKKNKKPKESVFRLFTGEDKYIKFSFALFTVWTKSVILYRWVKFYTRKEVNNYGYVRKLAQYSVWKRYEH